MEEVKKQPTESSLLEESPVYDKKDVADEEKKSPNSQKFGPKILEMSDEIREYQETLSKVAINKSADMIFNRGFLYSLSMISVIIKTATANIRVISLDDNLDYLCYDIIVKGIDNALQKGVNVEILTNVDVPKGTVLERYKGILKMIPKQVFDEYLKKKIGFSSFITGDDTMYRLEFKQETCSGLGSFNDSDMAGKFNDLFDYIYKQC